MNDPDIQDVSRNLLICMIRFLVKFKKKGELRAVSHHRSRFVTCACHISTHREVSHA